MGTQQRPVWIAQERSLELEFELMLVELVEEVDHWKTVSAALAREAEALRRERETLVAELRITDGWRRGLAEELADYAHADPWPLTTEPIDQERYEQDGDPFRGLVFGIPLGVLLWTVLILLGYAAYRLYAS